MPIEIDLTGRIALVTCGRREPEAGMMPDGVEFVVADVREIEQVQALVSGIRERHGRLDIAVNNAGGSPSSPASEASPRFSEKIIALNLMAALHVSQQANAVMQEVGRGVIVNVSSLSGMRPSPGTAAYGAAKAGLINLTETLAMEWAPKVRVNCVSGGLVLTEQADL